MGGEAEAAVAALESRMERTIAELVELSRIPGVSAEGFDAAQVARSAEHVAGLLGDSGLEDVEVLRVGSSHPYVLGEWLRAGDDAPTVLIYAHHDVQPPGRSERWETPAFEPTLRDDGRLYGRGVVDDKAGLMLHLAALRGWLESAGRLPVNVKLIVEGEEEIGSPHLEEFLRTHRERLAADVIVLSDTANLRTGLPALTTSLRGLVTLDVTARALEHPLRGACPLDLRLADPREHEQLIAQFLDDDLKLRSVVSPLMAMAMTCSSTRCASMVGSSASSGNVSMASISLLTSSRTSRMEAPSMISMVTVPRFSLARETMRSTSFTPSTASSILMQMDSSTSSGVAPG